MRDKLSNEVYIVRLVYTATGVGDFADFYVFRSRPEMVVRLNEQLDGDISLNTVNYHFSRRGESEFMNKGWMIYVRKIDSKSLSKVVIARSKVDLNEFYILDPGNDGKEYMDKGYDVQEYGIIGNGATIVSEQEARKRTTK